ncbi:MAG: DUF3347 domain-containing protein [Cytophagales bacterium]
MRSAGLIMMAALMWGSLSAQNLDKVFEDYIALKNHLVNGDYASALSSGELLVTFLDKLKEVSIDKSLVEDLLRSTKAIAEAGSIEQQRTAFAAQSVLMWQLINESEALGRDIYYNYCPMKKAHWISESAAIRNPFYGKQMLGCGKVEKSIKP